MESIPIVAESIVPVSYETQTHGHLQSPAGSISALERRLVWQAIRLRIFYFACIILKKPAKVWRLFRTMLRLRTSVWGGDLKKIYKIGGKYYFNMYTPGWPSAAYDELIKA